MRLAQCKTVVAAGLALVTVEAGAVPFISLDPRAVAMGGAGVAAARGVAAGFINPALLSLPDQQSDSIPVSAVGAWRSSDPDNVRDEVDRYQINVLEADFEKALANYKKDPTEVPAKALNGARSQLITQLKKLSTRTAETDIGAGLAVQMPGKKMALIADIQIIGGGKVVGAEKDIATYTALIDEGVNKHLPVADAIFNIIISGPNRNLETLLLSRGATITEIGVSAAKEVTIAGHKLAVGATPKYVNVNTFDYQHTINVATYDAYEGRKQYSTFNLDLGLAKEHGDGWRSGVAIKNLIPQKFQTEGGGDISIQPQLRAGVAHTSSWITAVADLDLNEGKALGYESDTRDLGLGLEVDFTKDIKLRAGYRYNLSNQLTNAVTVGLGAALFGAATDVAMTINEDEWGFMGRLGLQF